MKQRQNRPKSRAPHGSPKYSEQFACWVTKTMKRQLMRRGGSEFARQAFSAALRASE